MRPSQTLPEGYRQTGLFDITRDRRLVLLLNLLGLGLAALFWGVFSALLFAIRPAEAAAGLALEITRAGQMGLLGLVLVSVVMVALHEGAHGLFFWLFTRRRPIFAFKIAYAYAAMPGWYFPRRAYLVVGLAPLVLLSLAGVALMGVVPPGWFLGLLVFLVSNAAGAVGDLWVMGWLLVHPRGTLAEDRGDAVALYEKAAC